MNLFIFLIIFLIIYTTIGIFSFNYLNNKTEPKNCCFKLESKYKLMFIFLYGYCYLNIGKIKENRKCEYYRRRIEFIKLNIRICDIVYNKPPYLDDIIELEKLKRYLKLKKLNV